MYGEKWSEISIKGVNKGNVNYKKNTVSKIEMVVDGRKTALIKGSTCF